MPLIEKAWVLMKFGVFRREAREKGEELERVRGENALAREEIERRGLEIRRLTGEAERLGEELRRLGGEPGPGPGPVARAGQPVVPWTPVAAALPGEARPGEASIGVGLTLPLPFPLPGAEAGGEGQAARLARVREGLLAAAESLAAEIRRLEGGGPH
jgi:hypothetical protein